MKLKTLRLMPQVSDTPLEDSKKGVSEEFLSDYICCLVGRVMVWVVA